MRQPFSGFLATTMTVVVAWAIIRLFDFTTFTTWTAWIFMCAIPGQILISVSWKGNPSFVAHLAQPAKGGVLLLSTLAIAAVVAVVCYVTIGGGIAPPVPMLVVYTIFTVIVMFWLAIMFGGWPFVSLTETPFVSGLSMLVACYGLSFVVFRTFCNFAFLRGAPIYVPALDPGGLFDANLALAFIVTAVAVLFLLLHFDLWPLATIPSLMRQPILGIVWTGLALAIGGLAMHIGIAILHMSALSFMVKVPIPFIFGTIVVLNMLQGTLFQRLPQPVKGLGNAAVAMVGGLLLAFLYGRVAPILTGTLSSGEPGFDYERWVASALLGVTFPLLIAFSEYFKLWPLMRRRSS
ncbi:MULTISPECIES: hypothetical protein [unclassified Burkholderia]|uniref:hypothetical protein n=1 Tax=unclassified Burkholderia TaxID=2613784 RepID=UPI000B10DEA9|nr:MULTISPECIES: hypothetical protein [unclassified Burkholderia]TGN98708.1 hypothetical protein PL79_006680 [Burkholderia sp. USMB20]